MLHICWIIICVPDKGGSGINNTYNNENNKEINNNKKEMNNKSHKQAKAAKIIICNNALSIYIHVGCYTNSGDSASSCYSSHIHTD